MATNVSDTPETDFEFGSIARHPDNTGAWMTLGLPRRLERERNAMRDWILLAAPMLSTASCIVIDEAVERLGEIEGCRGVLEMCPVKFINAENA